MSDNTVVTPKKVHPDNEDFESLSKTELIARLKDQEQYIKQLESKRPKLDKDDDSESGERLKVQQKEAARKENTLVHRLTLKEQELQDYVNQVTEIKQAQTQGTAQLRSMLLDPAVNIVFQRMSKEMDEAQEKLKQTQNELSAWKFTADSQTGKRLMARCQMLLQENEELGKTISSGRTAKLEGEIALQKTLVTEMKNNQSELDEFLGDLEEDVEGMQTMIYVLQQQLRECKEQISSLEEENALLRSGCSTDNLKTLTVKQRDKVNCGVKSEPFTYENYTSFKDKAEVEYAPMETGYYQNDKTDSDLEAEYNYEGLYENEDKYQEEMEAKQMTEAEVKQFGCEENGYRSYRDKKISGTCHEEMDTSEVEDSSKVNDIEKLTSHGEQVTQEKNSDHINSTNSSKSHRQQATISSTERDNQQTETVVKQKTDVVEISKNPLGNGQHVDNSKDDENTEQGDKEKNQVTSQEIKAEITPEKLKNSKEDETEKTNEIKRTITEVEKRKTPEVERIPSPKLLNLSPGKTCIKNTMSELNADHSNSAREQSPGTDSPVKLNQAEMKDNSSPLTENNASSSNSKDKSKLREREPVLQQFLNGITSTVDDIEDL